MADLLVSDGSDGQKLVERFKALWHSLKAEAEEALLKEISLNRILNAKNLKLRGQVEKMSGEITELKAQVKSMEAQGAKQGERITGLLHEQFGQKSETAEARRRHSSTADEGDQNINGDLLHGKCKDFSARKPKKSRNTNGRAPKNWDNLERVEMDMGFPETCPCGCPGGIRTYDIDEKREVIPAKFYVAVRKYPRYRCLRENKIVGTLFKPSLLVGISTGTSMLAYLVTV